MLSLFFQMEISFTNNNADDVGNNKLIIDIMLLNETSLFLAAKQYLIFGKVYIFNRHLNIA